MKKLRLRQYHADKSNQQWTSAYWDSENIERLVFSPAPGAVLIAAVLNDGTTVCFDLRVWLDRKLVEIAGLRFDLITPDELIDYFFYSNPNIILTLPGIDERLDNFECISREDFRKMFIYQACNVDFAWVWFNKFPSSCIDEARSKRMPVNINAVSVSLFLSRGKSHLSARHVESLEIGDMLFINEHVNEIGFNGRFLCQFDEINRSFIMKDENESLSEQVENNIFNLNPLLESAKNAPVTLYFVVYRVELPLDEVSDIKEGDIIECYKNERGKVDVYANGALIAIGELVNVDDRLGIEITRVK